MLPTLSVPEFETEIPSTGKKIKFRPFLVREEKILLIALEDGEKEAIIRAVLDLLKNCIIDEINIENLPTFDVEYLFMQIRSKSVSETIEMTLRHSQDKECKARTKHIVKIEDIKLKGIVNDGKIQLTDKIGIKLKYPTYTKAKTLVRDTENLFKLVIENIEYVYDQDTVYDNFSLEEVTEWLDHLNKEQFEKIMYFFLSAPTLTHTIEWECKECKEKDMAIVEGLKDFFTLV